LNLLDNTNNEFAFVLEDLSKEEGNDRIVGAVTSIDDIESNAFFRHGRPYYKLGTATSSYKDGVGFTSYHVAGLAEDIYYMLFKRSAGYCTDAISMDAISGDGQILLDIAAQCSRSEVIGTPIYAGSTKPFELTELNVKFADANGKPFKDYYGNSIAEGGEFILLMYAVAKDPDVRTLPWGVRDGHVYAGIIDIPAATDEPLPEEPTPNLNSVHASKDVQIYTAAGEGIKITLRGKVSGGLAEVYDMNGKFVHSQKLQEGLNTLTETFPQGVYVVKVMTDDNRVVTGEVVVK